MAVASGAVGAFLTGEGGMTLYIFTLDSANTSTCVDGCAKTWPPFTVGPSDTLKAGDGVSGALTTFSRPDGSLQVAYDGAGRRRRLRVAAATATDLSVVVARRHRPT